MTLCCYVFHLTLLYVEQRVHTVTIVTTVEAGTMRYNETVSWPPGLSLEYKYENENNM